MLTKKGSKKFQKIKMVFNILYILIYLLSNMVIILMLLKMSKNVQKCPVFVVNRQKYDKENIMYNM
jgi:hypothetical protein